MAKSGTNGPLTLIDRFLHNIRGGGEETQMGSYRAKLSADKNPHRFTVF